MWRADSGGDSDPPPVPRDAPGAPRRGLPKVAIVLIRVCVGLTVAYFVACVAVTGHRMGREGRYKLCRRHLSALADGFAIDRTQDSTRAQRWSGSSLWLAMRRNTTHVLRGAESTLFCPEDDDADPPGDAAWDSVDLEHPPRELCSYAGRDFAAFPLDENATEPQPIGACVHHRDGVLVAFDNGWVQMMYREQIGLGPDDPMVVGPESKSPLLRMLVGGN